MSLTPIARRINLFKPYKGKKLPREVYVLNEIYLKACLELNEYYDKNLIHDMGRKVAAFDALIQSKNCAVDSFLLLNDEVQEPRIAAEEDGVEKKTDEEEEKKKD